MNITKCDICKKEIEKGAKSIHIGIGTMFAYHREICPDCGKPIFKFLKAKGLLQDENKKYERRK